MNQPKTLRPGGLELTLRALENLKIPPNARILDVGCGEGATVSLLRGLGHAAAGIDPCADTGMPHLVQGTAESLPFPDKSFDAVFFECSLSKVGDPSRAISEANRVLKAGGSLVITDLFAAGESVSLDGILGRIERYEEILNKILTRGFCQTHFEDCARELRSCYARMIFNQGPDEACAALGGSAEQLRRAKCSYFLAIFLKAADSALLPEKWDGKFTDAQMLSERGAYMLSGSQSEIVRIRSCARTSGTQSPPKRMWFSAEDIDRTVSFFAWGMGRIMSPGETCGIFMSDTRPDSIADLLRRGIESFGGKGVIYGGITDPEKAAEHIENCGTLVGMPGELFYMCRAYPRLRPGSVLLSGDYVSPSVIKAISETWKARVYSHYGLTESCYGLALECHECGLLHIRDRDFYAEIIDPETGALLPLGREGEIVLTSLHKRALPLVRYRTGDISTLHYTRCTCGFSGLSLGKIAGRHENLKSSINIHRLEDMLCAHPHILAFEAQSKNVAVHLTVNGGGLDVPSLEKQLGAEITLEYKAFFPEAGKKHRLT